MPGLKLMAELGLDGKGFASGFREAKGLAVGAAEGIRRVVLEAVGFGALEEAVRRTVESARQLVDTAERLEIAPKNLQVLGQAARNAGTDVEKITTGLEKLQEARETALKGDPSKLSAFFGLGINQQQLRTLNTDQLLMGPLRNAVMNGAAPSTFLKEVLGKSYGSLIPVLKTDFDALSERMQGLGMIMDTETAVKLKNLSEAFSGLSRIIYAVLGPALVQLSEWAMGIASHSKVLEGLDFLVRRWTGESKLPDSAVNGITYSARRRHDEAAEALDMMRNYQSGGKSVEQFIADRAGAKNFLGAGFGGKVETSPKFPSLGDDASKSWTEELHYLNKLIQPVADASNKAAIEAGNDMEEFRKSIDEWKKKMHDLAGELDKPGGDRDKTMDVWTKHNVAPTSDSLIKIGNFLGSNPAGLEPGVVWQKKTVEILHKIDGKIPQGLKGPMSHGPVSGEPFGSGNMGPFFPNS